MEKSKSPGKEPNAAMDTADVAAMMGPTIDSDICCPCGSQNGPFIS